MNGVLVGDGESRDEEDGLAKVRRTTNIMRTNRGNRRQVDKVREDT